MQAHPTLTPAPRAPTARPASTWRYAAWIGIAVALSGCGAGPLDRAARGGLTPVLLRTSAFPVQAAVPAGQDGTGRDGTLTVFIEGDGRAFVRRHPFMPPQPSDDPTPEKATGLDLALAEHAQGGFSAYLARPCQFGGRTAAQCSDYYWAEGRFAEPMVAAQDAALDQIRARLGARSLRLVGWSGGGIMAMLLAARRSDIAGVITIAAPLDHAAWTRRRERTPLHGSLALVPPPAVLSRVPQLHLLGSADDLVTPRDQAALLAALPQARSMTLPGVGHADGWVAHWPQLRTHWPGSREAD